MLPSILEGNFLDDDEEEETLESDENSSESSRGSRETHLFSNADLCGDASLNHRRAVGDIRNQFRKKSKLVFPIPELCARKEECGKGANRSSPLPSTRVSDEINSFYGTLGCNGDSASTESGTNGIIDGDPNTVPVTKYEAGVFCTPSVNRDKKWRFKRNFSECQNERLPTSPQGWGVKKCPGTGDISLISELTNTGTAPRGRVKIEGESETYTPRSSAGYRRAASLTAGRDSDSAVVSTNEERSCSHEARTEPLQVKSEHSLTKSGTGTVSSLFTLYDGDTQNGLFPAGEGLEDRLVTSDSSDRFSTSCGGTGVATKSEVLASKLESVDQTMTNAHHIRGGAIGDVTSEDQEVHGSTGMWQDVRGDQGIIGGFGATPNELREMRNVKIKSISGASLTDPNWHTNIGTNHSQAKKAKLHLATKVWSVQDRAVVQTMEPKVMQKRKHQINWLAAEAHEKELEMLEMTARHRQSKYQTQMKYGW